MPKRYDQYCGIAHALDMVGERWALLVVRELMRGPKRYTDLAEHLPGIGTNILASRLRDLEEHGIVTKRKLPPPAASRVYELTDYGRSLKGVLRELALWGAQSIGPPTDEDELYPGWLENALDTVVAPVAPPGRFEFRADGEVASLVDGETRARSDRRARRGRRGRPAGHLPPVRRRAARPRDDRGRPRGARTPRRGRPARRPGTAPGLGHSALEDCDGPEARSVTVGSVTKFALGALFARKLRTILTALAIVLGVAMVAGTYILTDSIDQAFDSIFTDVREGSNAVITGRSAFDVTEDSGVAVPSFDEALLGQVQQLPDVADAEGSVDAQTQLIGDDGKAIVYGGSPNIGFSIARGDSPFNPLTLVEGAWPRASEVVIDEATADKEGFEIGDLVGVQAEGPVQQVRISGFAKFGSVSTIGGATLAGFDLPTAQRLFGKEGKLDEIAVAAKAGVSDRQLVSEIRAMLPPGTEVRSGQAQAQEDAEDTDEFISFLQTFLLSFGGIALFVGSFVIANSLSITIAQRTREFATLRTLGASRRQVLRAVILEALVVGILASVVGLFLGLALAKGLFSLFDAVGFTLPNSGLTLADAHDRRGAPRRHPRDADRQPAAGDAGDPGAADRRRARRAPPCRRDVSPASGHRCPSCSPHSGSPPSCGGCSGPA